MGLEWRWPSKSGGESDKNLSHEAGELWDFLRRALGRVVQLLEARRPQGFVVHETLAVNSDAVALEYIFPQPAFTVWLINDGAGTVRYRFPKNGAPQFIDLLPTEEHETGFPYPAIPFLQIILPRGGATATVRMRAVY